MSHLSQLLRISAPVLSVAFFPVVIAEENRVRFPQSIGELVHYTTVNRGNVTEHMLTSQEALDAVEAGNPIPNGTQVILADYREGEIYRYFVMEKGEGWGEDYPDYRRTQDWQFQWYWPDGSVNMDEDTQRCQSCHQSRENENYMFTYGDLRRFIERH